ncbi:hypothetical protein ElyMa_007068700 [Elysia marginata]|uniref:Uncharacterized protein n=1 Tax=Elysia marginata TaxID=1093978 RepID=A0AAV4JX07_9GAST|nr:hypothetical protein ElyMa_007068700 [Elysia marginata]
MFRSRSTPSTASTSRSASLTPKRPSNHSLAASRNASLLNSTSKRSSRDLAVKISDPDVPDGLLSQGPSRKGERKWKCPPHGFRYHSNGDERVSKSLSASSSSISSASLRAEKAAISFSELSRLRSGILRSSMPTNRQTVPATKLGVHYSGPELDRKLPEGRPLVSSSSPFRVPTRASSEPVVEHRENRGRASAVRAVPTRETDTMFKRTILRHIHDMAHSRESVSRASVTRVTSALSDDRGTPAGRALVSRDTPSSLTQTQVQHKTESQGDCLSAANSSFNMRYGVPVKLMAQRKHILDEQHFKEVRALFENSPLYSFIKTFSLH